MKKLTLLLLTALALAGCGGDAGFSGSSSASSSSSSGASAASVQVLVSSPQLPSDNSAPVEVTAYVLNSANQAVAGVPVFFQTNSGYLNKVTPVTDANGVATATLNTLATDPGNRTITVTATAGSSSDSIDVNVVGTSLTIKGSSSIVQGASANYVVTLINAGGKPIAGQTVAVNSAKGNPLTAATLATDTNGQVTASLTGSIAGTDTVSVTALGITSSQNVTISDDSFAFTAPSADVEIPLNQPTTVNLTWTIAGAPQAGKTITFSTTRGTLTSATAVTNGSGVASLSISSTNAGFATLTASTDTGTTTTLPVEFVATLPTSINLQASPASISTSSQSIITAIVRDAANNLVKNQTVTFTLDDVTNGTLSVGSALTDSQGIAQTVYTAGATTSASNGVKITGTIAATGMHLEISNETNLTVGNRVVFISLGTGNDIGEDDAPIPTQYKVPYAIQVTDSNGNAVPSVTLTMKVLSQFYAQGARCDDGSGNWVTVRQDIHPDEDINHNGILDTGEDANNSTSLEAGNIASIINATSSASSITTNSNGFAYIYVVYPKEYAAWVAVTLSATTSVQGTETTRSVNFWLPYAVTDFKTTVAAPGMTSPFGIGSYSYPHAPSLACN